MALRLEVSTLAGISIPINIYPEDTVLKLRCVAECKLNILIKHLVTADAHIIGDEKLAIADANIKDGDVLQALAMTEDDKIDAIVKDKEKQMEFIGAIDPRVDIARSGEYVIIAIHWELTSEDYDRWEYMLHHLTSWRRGGAALDAAVFERGDVLGFCDGGYELIFVGDGEYEKRRRTRLDRDDGTVYRKSVDSLLHARLNADSVEKRLSE
ncbi:unnamed protein product [Symbiodinium microadriaticum]|nr:unnamed protein product [Symbiodinium microadriaticum]